MIEAHRDCLSAAGLRGIRRCRSPQARDENEVPHDLPLLAAQDSRSRRDFDGGNLSVYLDGYESEYGLNTAVYVTRLYNMSDHQDSAWRAIRTQLR
jgi:hypothetical protein